MTATADAPRRAARKPKSRTIALLAYLSDVQGGIFRVTEDGKPETYFFKREPSDFGTAFTVEKYALPTAAAPGGIVKTYHVNLNGEESSCECLGHLKWSHKTVCRHVGGLAKLIADGKVP